MRHVTPPEILRFYPSQPYPCPYLPERTARSCVATPAHLVDAFLGARRTADAMPGLLEKAGEHADFRRRVVDDEYVCHRVPPSRRMAGPLI